MSSRFWKNVRKEDAVETVEQYRSAYQHADSEYGDMVGRFYELVTEFYEFAWGSSFHFAPGKNGVSFDQSIADHQYFLGDVLNLKPDMKVLDAGSGIGGPQRSLAQKYGATITALNISELQLRKCVAYNRQAGLENICHVMMGDLMAIPARDESFDAIYQIEAFPHVPDKQAVYEEVFRVLKPGAIFAGYDWCMTPSFDANNAEHCTVKKDIEFGNALPQIVSFTEIDQALRAVGFDMVETFDRATEADADTPWYTPLLGNLKTLRGLPRSTLGRKLTTVTLRTLERLRLMPEGAFQTAEILNLAADSLVAGGRLDIFTPMLFHKARKPN